MMTVMNIFSRLSPPRGSGSRFISAVHVVWTGLADSRCPGRAGSVAGGVAGSPAVPHTLLVAGDWILIEARLSSASCRVRPTEFEVTEKGHVDCLRSFGKR